MTHNAEVTAIFDALLMLQRRPQLKTLCTVRANLDRMLKQISSLEITLRNAEPITARLSATREALDECLKDTIQDSLNFDAHYEPAPVRIRKVSR